MASATSGRYVFGDFELDVGTYELRRAGTPVHLEGHPKSFLILLIERRPHLVTRQEIAAHLWGDGTCVEAETGINTIVHKVRQALGDSATAPVFVGRVPGKGYRFVAPVEEVPVVTPPDAAGAGAVASEGPVRPAVARVPAARWFPAAGAVVLVTALGAGPLLVRPAVTPMAPAGGLARLTSLTGSEIDPVFSPDGQNLAFAWTGEAGDNFDIYVQRVGSDALRRLTTDPAADRHPAWSPDGRFIAYTRSGPGASSEQVRVMTALGDADRPVSDLGAVGQVSWSPDGRHVAVGRARPFGTGGGPTGIELMPVEPGQPHPLTHPAEGGDHSPAFSPDGRQLAFVSCRQEVYLLNCHLMVVAIGGGWATQGTPRLGRTTDRFRFGGRRRLVARVVGRRRWRGPAAAHRRDGRSDGSALVG